MTPEISVIIPHLNQPAGLERLIESLDAQTPATIPFEIIVADNGSSQSLPIRVTQNEKVRVVHEPLPGPGPARNRAVAVARGRILAFTDSDCLADPHWIAAINRHFQSEGAAEAIGGDVRILPRGPRLDAIEAYESIYAYRQELYIRRDGYAATCNLAVRRDVFARIGPFAGIHIAEDRDWGRRATAAGVRHAFLPEMVIHTPARETFSELARKWDRHIAHDFAMVQGRNDRLRWILRSLAIALSPLAEVPRLLTSPRVRGARSRFLAAWIVLRIRLLRARRMLQLAAGGDAEAMAYGWHKK